MKKKVGVIGGMGPMATIKFMELVLKYTNYKKDQDNIDMIVCQYPSIPDRTNYIINKNNSPLPKLIKTAKMLECNSCDFIAIPCNTVEFFYDELSNSVNIPIIDMVEETLNYAIKTKGAKKIGLMATSGTIKSKVYENRLYSGVKLFIPNEQIQQKIMSMIYNTVKVGNKANRNEFLKIIDYFKENDCDIIVTGCTELSCILLELDIKDKTIIDSLDILAKKTVELAM